MSLYWLFNPPVPDLIRIAVYAVISFVSSISHRLKLHPIIISYQPAPISPQIININFPRLFSSGMAKMKIRHYLATAFVSLTAMSGQCLAETTEVPTDAKATLEKSPVYRLYKAALVEWTADNCSPAISAERAVSSKAILSEENETNAVELFRTLNAERAVLLRDRGYDPCDLAIRDVFTPVEQSKKDLQARTAAERARIRPLREATLIEWVAKNCSAAVDQKTAAQAQQTLKDFNEDEVRFHRRVVSSEIHLETESGNDACKSVLNEISSF